MTAAQKLHIQGKDGGLRVPSSSPVFPGCQSEELHEGPAKLAPWVTEARREFSQEGFRFGVGHDG